MSLFVFSCRNLWPNGDSVGHGSSIASPRVLLSVQVIVVDTYQARYQQVSFSHRKPVGSASQGDTNIIICCDINTLNTVVYPRLGYPRVSPYAIPLSITSIVISLPPRSVVYLPSSIVVNLPALRWSDDISLPAICIWMCSNMRLNCCYSPAVSFLHLLYNSIKPFPNAHALGP